MTHNDVFDYNQIVKALTTNEKSIENVTQSELELKQFEKCFFFIYKFCRLKFMQAIGLVLGDDFLVQFNLTINTEDVSQYIKNLTWDWNSHNKNLTLYRTSQSKEKKLFQVVSFDDHWGGHFAEILVPFGFCYIFNIMESNELFNLDK
jgi:hypothetical protein